MSLVLNNSDTFNRSNGEIVGSTMSDNMGVWASRDNTTGVHSIVSNQYNSGAGSWSNVPLYNTNMSATQGDQAAEITLVSNTFSGGPVVRYSSGTYYYIGAITSTSLVIYAASTGYPGTVLATLTGLTINNTSVIKLEAIGSTLTAYVDGSSVGSATDSNYTAGRCGIWNAFSQTCDSYNDYIPAPPAPTFTGVSSATGISTITF